MTGLLLDSNDYLSKYVLQTVEFDGMFYQYYLPFSVAHWLYLARFPNTNQTRNWHDVFLHALFRLAYYSFQLSKLHRLLQMYNCQGRGPRSMQTVQESISLALSECVPEGLHCVHHTYSSPFLILDEWVSVSRCSLYNYLILLPDFQVRRTARKWHFSRVFGALI